MNRSTQWLVALGLLAAYVWWRNQQGGTPAAATADTSAPSATDFTVDPLAAVADTVESLTVGWKNTGSGPDWLPTLATAEITYGIPTDLLSRVAYQESHFREPIIRGTQSSPAGALGLMQLMPQYFSSVNVAIPFTDSDVVNQINQAAQNLKSLFGQLGSWPLALAGYNAGAGNVQKYGGVPPFPETQNYVASILSDVPSANV